VNMFDASFAEHDLDEGEPPRRHEGASAAMYGANMLPLDYTARNASTPLFVYPYARSREALEQLYRNGPVHACHGIKMQYVNPATGGYPMPTIAAFLQLLPGGFQSTRYRSTDATVFNVVEGHGRSQVGSEWLTWGPHDIIVAPSWYPVVHEVQGDDAVLFSFSDRASQRALGLWREETNGRERPAAQS
jgi:gentisate 1,2-dioxygenase